MRKIYFLFSALLITSFGCAQYKVGNGPVKSVRIHQTPEIHKLNNTNKAVGDTLFFFDGQGFYISDSNDQNDFILNNEDYDGYQPAASTTWPSDFIYSFYSTDPADFITGYDTDTAWYIGAASWFNPAAQADNWWNFGPITIPAGAGADFSWYERHNPAWTDAFDIYVLTSVSSISNGAQAYVDADPANDTPFYTRTGINSPTPQPGQDTLWTSHTISLNAFAGQRVWIMFNHDMNDGDLLQLDHMVITEQPASVEDLTSNDIELFQNTPNPVKNNTMIKFNLSTSTALTLEVVDVTGKMVQNHSLGLRATGTHQYQCRFRSGAQA